jgi:hypothetical protein
MSQIELFRWYLNGSAKPTRWLMTAADARARDPNARPDLASREQRSANARGNEGAAIVRAGGGAPRP